MTRIRRLGALLVAAPLALAFPVLGAAVPANAAISGSITSPSNGKVITSGSSTTVRAEYFGLAMDLWVDTPGGGWRVIASGGLLSRQLSGSVGIGRNGRYQAQLKGKSTIVYDSNTFYVRIPPAAPSRLSASPSGGKVTVRWNRGSESDLTGYSVTGGLGSKIGSASSLCSGASCSVVMPGPANASRSVPVTVRARRSTGTGGTISSAASSTAVSFAGQSGGSGPNGSAGVNPPGSGPNGSSPLNPLNGGSPMTLPSVQPDGAIPGFAYPTPDPVVAGPDGGDANNAAARDSLQWGKSVAIALVLLIIAAHLGTWTRRLRVAQAGFNSLGMAARIARSGTGRTRVQRARDRIARAEASAKTTKKSARTAKSPAKSHMPAPSVERTAGGPPGFGADRQPAASALNAKAATVAMPTGLEASGIDILVPRDDWPAQRSNAQSAGRGSHAPRARQRSDHRRS